MNKKKSDISEIFFQKKILKLCVCNILQIVHNWYEDISGLSIVIYVCGVEHNWVKIKCVFVTFYKHYFLSEITHILKSSSLKKVLCVVTNTIHNYKGVQMSVCNISKSNNLLGGSKMYESSIRGIFQNTKICMTF